jgi:hypothetical protein
MKGKIDELYEINPFKKKIKKRTSEIILLQKPLFYL